MSEPAASPETTRKSQPQPTADRILGGMFLVGVAGVSMLFGFGRSFAAAKKREKIVDHSLMNRMEGNSLALRALGWGTVAAVTGVGIICYGIWTAMGVSNMEEFRQKAGQILPEIPKKENPGARTEFKNLTELFQYVIDEDNRAKQSTNSSLEKPNKPNKQDS